MTIPLQSTNPASFSSSSSSSIPPRTALLTNLITQTNTLHTLFTQLSTPPSAAASASTSTTAPSLPELYTSLHQSTDELANLVRGVWDHQLACAELDGRKKEVVGLERRVRELIGSLEKGRRELEEMVDGGREVKESIDSLEARPIPVPTLLAHARSLARHSSAPVSSLLNSIDKAQYQPWPTENAMRAGILFMEGGSMASFGEIGKQGEERIKEDVPVGIPQVTEERPRQHVPRPVFDLDLNSDDSDDE